MIRGESSSWADSAALEATWSSLGAAVTAWALFAVGLARADLFRGWALLIAGFLSAGVGWAFWRLQESARLRIERRETLFLPLLVALGLLLFGWPSEQFPQMGDASIYPNTAAMLIRTGGLTYHYDPLDGLTPEQKQSFYVPSDRQLPTIEIQSYEGLLYGAYYVTDADRNTVVSSRPPVLVTWMGLLGMIFGKRGMLYVTPLFGVASLVTVYFLGKRVFDAGVGGLAALWLLLSFPQLHFSRASYAEVVGQFFVLTAVYALVTYLQTRRLIHIPLGIAALTVALAARIDAILALPTLLPFLILLAVRADWKGLAAVLTSVIPAIGFTWWTVNRPYVGATGELLLFGQLRFLRRLDFWIALGLTGILGPALLVLAMRRLPRDRLLRVAGYVLSLALVVVVGYALHVRPLAPEYVVLDGEVFFTHNEEILALAARYVSPLSFWLAVLGSCFITLNRGRVLPERLLLLFFVAFFTAAFSWRYTTARVYPVALRRFVPEVLPGLFLLAAFALRRLARRAPWRWMALATAGLMMILLMNVSAPYWFHLGAEGAEEALASLAAHLPQDAMVLFEPTQDGSIVGAFAAPLWSFYQRRALLLNTGELDSEALNQAICSWQGRGREIYLVSWRDPTEWWPGELEWLRENEVVWDSSIIGQSQNFPPSIWRFSFTFPIYRWEGEACSSTGGEGRALPSG